MRNAFNIFYSLYYGTVEAPNKGHLIHGFLEFKNI